jgi:hypothetical protein
MWTATVEQYMKIRYLTAAGVIAAMVAMAGCQPDDTWDDDAGTTTDTWGDDRTGTEAGRAPPPGTADGAQQTWEYDPQNQETEQVGQQRETGQYAETEQGTMGAGATTDREGMGQQPGGEADVDMTEFAALDTDATGTITEEQWVPEAVGGVEFSEVDRDGDGVVTREEFRQHFMEDGAGAGAGGPGTQQ